MVYFQNKYLPLKEAAKIFGYNPDYIGYLIRDGKIKGRRIYNNFSWKVSRRSVIKHCKERKRELKDLNIQDKYLSLKQAAKLSGYAPSYMGYLIREKKIEGRKVPIQVSWLVSKGEIERYQKLKKKKLLGRKRVGQLSVFTISQRSYKVFSKGWRLSLSALIILLLISGLAPAKFLQSTIGAIFIDETKTINFYTSLCGGDWQNPENVQGEPELLSTSNINSFSEFNSAVYKTGPLSIICQNFKSPEIITEEPLVEEQEEITTALTTTEVTPIPLTQEEQVVIEEEATSTEATTTETTSIIQAPTSTSSVIKEEATSSQFEIKEEPTVLESTTTEIATTSTTTSPESPISFLDKIKKFFGFQTVVAQEETFSAKIKLSFAIGEKELDILPINDIATSTGTSTEGLTGLWNKVKEFFGSLVTKVASIAQAEESTTTEALAPDAGSVGTEQVTTTEATVTTEEATTTEATITEVTTTEATTTPEIATTTDSLPNLDTRIIIWWSRDGQNWQILDTISSYPISNALNNGYFSYDAPFLQNFEDIENLKIKVEGVIGGETQVTTFLDSVWVELEYQEEIQEEQEDFELRPLKEHWRADEEPVFEIISTTQKEEQNLIETIVDQISSFFEEPPKVKAKLNTPLKKGLVLEEGQDFSSETHSPTKIKIFKSEDFRPGLYNIEISFEKKGKTYNFNQEFTWGVLAINVNKSIYLPQEEAYIQMGVLDEYGYTVCDANLKLEITAPDGTKTVFSTEREEEIATSTEATTTTEVTTTETILPEFTTTKATSTEVTLPEVISTESTSTEEIIEEATTTEATTTEATTTAEIIFLEATSTEATTTSATTTIEELQATSTATSSEDLEVSQISLWEEIKSLSKDLVNRVGKRLAFLKLVFEKFEPMIAKAKEATSTLMAPISTETSLPLATSTEATSTEEITGKQSEDATTTEATTAEATTTEVTSILDPGVIGGRQDTTTSTVTTSATSIIDDLQDTSTEAITTEATTTLATTTNEELQLTEVESLAAERFGTIEKSTACGPKTITYTPDYFARYQAGEIGKYQMKLTNLDTGYEIIDSFEVREWVPFDVERIGPTRIWPIADYQMTLKIKVNQDFAGQLIETVPLEFSIENIEYRKNDETLNANFYLLDSLEAQEIHWQVDINKDDLIELVYTFDAPDISPYLFLSGPLQFKPKETNAKGIIGKIGEIVEGILGVNNTSQEAAFQEIREWQIASDAPGLVEVLRPNATGTRQDWSASGTATHWEATTDQDDSTYVYITTTVDIRESEDVDNPSFDIYATINSVTTYARCQVAGGGGGPEKFQILTRTLSTDYFSAKKTLPDAPTWTDFSETYTTNPETTNPWTYNEVRALEIGAMSESLGNNETIRCAEFWANVDYTYRPSITSVSDSPDPVAQGSDITFSVDWAKPDPAGGADWTQATSSAQWTGRNWHTSVVYDSKMWVIGGYLSAGPRQNDVWYSVDGADWTQTTSGAQWAARYGHASVNYDNKIWVTGGNTEASGYVNDVWYSEDGIDWTQTTAGAQWEERHEHTLLAYDDKMWMIGGATDTASNFMNDVWYSTDGADWTQAIAGAQWTARFEYGSVVYDNKMWVMGGWGGSAQNDVWYSTDGADWTQTTAGAQWETGSNLVSVLYDSKMWVIGGSGGTNNEVWYSTDGVDWTQATAGAAWEGRPDHTALTYNNKMWVMGGHGSFYNDVWYSGTVIKTHVCKSTLLDSQTTGGNCTDGSWESSTSYTADDPATTTYTTTANDVGTQNYYTFVCDNSGASTACNEDFWTEATSSAQWTARWELTSLAYDNKMWMIGGGTGNDVWYSTDGVAWTQATSSAQWEARESHTSLVYDNKMWVIGGTAAGLKNDVWYSTDGIDWTQTTSGAQWASRYNHTSVVYDNKMWVIGGWAGSNQNDVWYSTDGVDWATTTDAAQWIARSGHASVVYDNKMWVISGGSGGAANDVWYSVDGADWTQTTVGAQWGSISEHTSVVYDNKMWVMGGWVPTGRGNDVWYSIDGIDWTQAATAQWRGRNSHTSVVYNNKLWVMGGTTASGNQNDVWYWPQGSGTFYVNAQPSITEITDAPDPVNVGNDITFSATWWDSNIAYLERSIGKNWTQATSSAQWPYKRFHTSVVYNSKMWVMGGTGAGGNANDIWYSTDGIDWTEATTGAQWAARTAHTSVVYDNKMWVIGGNTDGGRVNDVWYSTDGVTWATTTDAAQWVARTEHTSLVYDDKMWVIGGASTTRLNDVWYSTDGIDWTEATSSAQWTEVTAHTSVVYDSKMWVIGGNIGGSIYTNDVWYSTDGIDWTQATAGAQWANREDHTSVVYDNKMWVIGGYSGSIRNDVWYSTDGIDWTQATAGAQWKIRQDHVSVVYDNKMWVNGGQTGFYNDVWYSDVGTVSVKLHICKTNEVTNATSGGACATSQTWASTTSYSSSTPATTTYTALSGDVGTNDYYGFVCDNIEISNSCSNTTANSTSTFTVQSQYIDISGTVFTDEGNTSSTAGSIVSLVVDGTWTASTTASTTDGSYSFASTTATSGVAVSVYLDNSSEKGVSVTRSVQGNISDLDIYTNRIIVRYEDSGPITISDLDHYDEDQDIDLLYTASSTAGTLTASSTSEFFVWTGKTFGAWGTGGVGGAISLADLDIDGTYTATSTQTISISGSWDNASGTFNSASSTVQFTSDGTGETVDTGDSPFYNVTFNNSSGGWTILSNASSTNDWFITSATSFVATSSITIEVQGQYNASDSVAAVTTWDSGSVLYLNSSSSYTIGSKNQNVESYQTIKVGPNTDIKIWLSSAISYDVDASSSLYSMDHNNSDGSLYIWGDYHITSGTTEYWSWQTDFDGTDLTGSERQSDVRLATSTPTTTVTLDIGGSFNIVGSSTATTTIDRQGASGNYAISIEGGTLNASYYNIRSIDSDGLNISGTTTITSLDYGDYQLDVDGGTMITVASTTIDANAAETITGCAFSTSTGVSSGFNVTATGTASSYWRFASSSGNYDGEQYDSDPGGDPGYIRWDDSTYPAVITQRSYIFENDDGSDVNSNSDMVATNTAVTEIKKGQRLVARFQIDNTSGASTSVYKVQYDKDSDGKWTDLAFGGAPSSNSGATTSDWNATTVDTGGANDVGQYSSIAIGTDGYPVISYWDASTTALMFAKCGNVACTSGNTTTTVDSGGVVGEYTSIAIGTDGYPVISYYDAANTNLMFAKCGNASCTSGNTTTTVDSGDSVGAYTSIAISTDGYPVISYRDDNNTALMVAKCGNASCTSGNTTTTVDSSGVGPNPSIAISTDGYPVISYWVSGNNLLVAKCGNASCTSGNTTTTVDSSGEVGWQTSIAIGTDGYPVISYYNYISYNLQFAKCNNASCTSVSTATVDSAGDVGKYTSIAVGTDGYPVISYYDASSTALKIAKCGSTDCSSGNTLITVDSAGDVGFYTSLTIGTDGWPVVSYFNNTDNTLKIAKMLPIVELQPSWGLSGTSTTALNATATGACASSTTWQAGLWYEATASSSSISLGANKCTELAFMIDTSEATASTTYRLRLVYSDDSTLDGYQSYPTLTIVSESQNTERYSKEAVKTSASSCGGTSEYECTKTPYLSDGVGLYTSIAIGTDGYPVISHQNQNTNRLLVTKCNSADCSASTTNQISYGTEDIGLYTSIAIGTDGYPVISHQNNTSSDRLLVTKCNNADCSTFTTNAISYDSNLVGRYSSIAIGSDGYPVISHQNQNTNRLLVTKCNSADCSASTTNQISYGTDNIGLWTSIAIGTDGYPVISHGENTGTLSLLVTKCNNLDCSASTTNQIIYGAANIGRYSAIAIGSDGYPVIAYHNFDEDTLLVTKCYTSDCSATSTTNHFSSYYAREKSIAIGKDGYPIIAHYYASNQYLTVTKCQDLECSTSNATHDQISYGTDNVGEYPSIAIGTDGYPVISHQNLTGTTTLMVTKALGLPKTAISYFNRYIKTDKQVKYTRNLWDNATTGALWLEASPAIEDGLTYWMDKAGYTAVSTTTDNSASSTITSSGGTSTSTPLFVFTEKHATNTNSLYARWIGQSTASSSVNNIKLEVFRFGNSSSTTIWETIATSTSCNADSDCTIDGSVTASTTDYYFPVYNFNDSTGTSSPEFWTFFRAYQEEGSQTLKTDYWKAQYTAFAVAPDISGYAYSGEGTGPLSSKTIYLKVNGGGDATTTTNGSGYYIFSDVSSSAGDTITVYIDNDAATGTTVTVTDGSTNISDMDIYQNHIIVRDDNTGSGLTIANMVYWDKDNDTDVQFTATTTGTDTLTVDSPNELYIWSTSAGVFSPNGNVTTYDIDIRGTFNAAGTESHTVSGSWFASSTSGFSAASSTVTFTATTAKTITTDGDSFYNLTFNGSGGVWTFQDAATTTNDLTITAGTASSTYNMYVYGGDVTGNGTLNWTANTFSLYGTGEFGGTSPWTFYHLTFGDGTTDTTTATSTVSATTTVSGNLTVTSNQTLTGAKSFTVNGGSATGDGTINLISGTFLLDGTGNFGGTSEWTLYNLTFGDGSGSASTTAGSSETTTISNLLTIDSNQELFGGTKYWTLSGSSTPFVISGTFTANTSTFQYVATGNTTTTATTYYNLELSPSGAGSPTYTIGAGTLTTNNYLTIGDGTNGVTVTADINDSTLDILGNFTIATSSIFTAPNSGRFSIGGNWANTGTFNHSTSTVVFDATAAGKTIDTSGTTTGKTFFNLTFDSASGGWTVQNNDLRVENNLNLAYASSLDFSNRTIIVEGRFINSVGGATTTWTGSTLDLNSLRGNSSLDFDGSQDYVQCGWGGSLDIGTSDFSLEAWIKTSTTSNYQYVIGKGDMEGGASAKPYYLLRVDQTTGYANAGLRDGSDGTGVGKSGNTNVADGKWHHLMATFDRDDVLTLYVDGQSQGTTSISGESGNLDDNVNFSIGARYNSGAYGLYFNGIIDEVRAYNRVLGSSEVLEHYQGAFRDESGSVGLWHLTEGTGTTTADSSGYGNTGTFYPDLSPPSWSTQAPLYPINTKNLGGDLYDTLQIGADTDVRMWNSYAATNTVDSTASLYSMDHDQAGDGTGDNGKLFSWRDYHTRSVDQPDYCSYGTDFDGTDISGSERQCQATISSNASWTVDSGATLNVLGGGSSSGDISIIGQGASASWDFACLGTCNIQESTWNYPNFNNGTTTVLNTDLNNESVTATGTLDVDWYLGIHVVAENSTSTDIGSATATISSTSTAEGTIWKMSSGSWGTASTSQWVLTQSSGSATGTNPQPNSDGAIRIREYRRTSSATTTYKYNLEVAAPTGYSNYSYYAKTGKYITSSSSTESTSTVDRAISENWQRDNISSLNGSKDYDGLDQSPLNGTWYAGMDSDLEFSVSLTSIDLDLFSPNFTDIGTTTLSATTSYPSGFTIRVHMEDTEGKLATSSYEIIRFPNDNDSPAAWDQSCSASSTCGFGYTTDDSNLTGGTVDRFTDNAFCGAEAGNQCWAGFATSSLSTDPVADTTSSGSQSNILTVRASVNVLQEAETYTGNIYLIATVNY